MHIGITGASGFIGRQTVREALSRGHRVTPFSRKSGISFSGCEPARYFGRELDLNGIEAIIHLAGESILGLWTKSKRDKILRSRIDGTRWIVDAIAKERLKPSVLAIASGVGIYGDRGEESLAESSSRDSKKFLAQVAAGLETEASKAGAFGTRSVAIRIGLVLGSTGGAAPLMKAAFGLGLGGKLGSGRQWMPWIHVSDVAALFLHAIETEAAGPIMNGAAPNPVRNEEFTRIIGAQLRRPTLLPVPAFALRLIPGDMASLVLDSQRVVPEVPLRTGFRFRFPDLQSALADVLR
ncbi:MAG TPA: TIGR01777 family oxidoreductase [Chthoniobacterales bacterium]|nr:TIGR01777 family oxidoreductase [Chthoniobacterales bacterium]